MFMDLYANNEMTKPSFLMNPVFVALMYCIFFYFKICFRSLFSLFKERERERERERMSFFSENHSMLLIAACFITETCPCKMQRFVSAVKK